jgi:hypothetical protein
VDRESSLLIFLLLALIRRKEGLDRKSAEDSFLCRSSLLPLPPPLRCLTSERTHSPSCLIPERTQANNPPPLPPFSFLFLLLPPSQPTRLLFQLRLPSRQLEVRLRQPHRRARKLASPHRLGPVRHAMERPKHSGSVHRILPIRSSLTLPSLSLSINLYLFTD